jgi:hypothetical protein
VKQYLKGVTEDILMLIATFFRDVSVSSSSYQIAQLGAPMPRHVVGSTTSEDRIPFGVRGSYVRRTLPTIALRKCRKTTKASVRIALSASTPALFLLPARRGWRQGSPSIEPYPSRAAVDGRQANRATRS